jgi:hypothetical protein
MEWSPYQQELAERIAQALERIADKLDPPKERDDQTPKDFPDGGPK